MSEATIVMSTLRRTPLQKLVGYGLWSVLCLHALVLAAYPRPVSVSRYLTAVIPVLGGIACVWRAWRLPTRERPVWVWSGASLFLWALAHVIETVFGGSGAASSLTIDASDFIYLAATFPLLVALSTTRETASLRSLFALNLAQIGLALILSYWLLYRTALSPHVAATVMGRIYGAACLLLALMAILRFFTWATEEERQSVRWLCVVVWTYVPIELGMDYATARWNLHSGTLLDLLWSVPFFLGGWQALHVPIAPSEPDLPATPSRARLMVEAICPVLMTLGIFALAGSVIRQHTGLGLSAIVILLAIQGVQAAVVQLNYLAGRNMLLEREQDLRSANIALRQMSLEDPLTHISNRRRFESALESSWRRGVRKQQAIAILMIDVDFFKGVNDHHGHSYGDECLVSIARIMKHHARRPDDVVARIGGEEFVLLLPDTGPDGAETIASRLQEAIRALGVTNRASPLRTGSR